MAAATVESLSAALEAVAPVTHRFIDANRITRAIKGDNSIPGLPKHLFYIGTGPGAAVYGVLPGEFPDESELPAIVARAHEEYRPRG